MRSGFNSLTIFVCRIHRCGVFVSISLVDSDFDPYSFNPQRFFISIQRLEYPKRQIVAGTYFKIQPYKNSKGAAYGRAHACMNMCRLLLPSFVPWTFFHFPESIANRKHSKYVERCSASYVCKDLFLFRFRSTISDCMLPVMQIPYVRAISVGSKARGFMFQLARIYNGPVVL